MTVLDSSRPASPTDDPDSTDRGRPGRGRPARVRRRLPPLRALLVRVAGRLHDRFGPAWRGDWRTAAGGGASAALAGLLMTLVFAGIAGPLAPRADIDWGATFGVGAGLWLLAGGGRLVAEDTTIAFTPLLATVLLLISGSAIARRRLPATGNRRMPWIAFTGGYAAVTLAAAGLTYAGPMHPAWWSLPLPGLVVPVLVILLASWRAGRLDDAFGWLPRAVRAAITPATRAAVALLAAGSALVLAAVVFHLPDVARLHEQLGTGLAGGVLLSATQVLALPNLGLWAVALLTGPGFSITEGAATSLSGSTSGLLPLVPVLGALPQPGNFGWYAWLLLLVPILVGAYGARLALRRIPRLASMRTKVTAATTTIVLATLALAALDGFGGGALGHGLLRDVGVSAPALILSLLSTMGGGAAVVVLRDWWRLRR